MATLAFTDLVRGFGQGPVLDRVSGEVHSGEVLLIRGDNGCGKSTLLRILAGLLRPQSGSVDLTIDEEPIDVVDRRRCVGYVAPDLAFYEPLTAAENIEFFARLRRLPATPGLEALRGFGVPTDRPVGALSSGQRQRLRWSWALLHRPELLLLDEPFQNLDDDGVRLATEHLEHHLEHGFAVVASPAAIELPQVDRSLDLS